MATLVQALVPRPLVCKLCTATHWGSGRRLKCHSPSYRVCHKWQEYHLIKLRRYILHFFPSYKMADDLTVHMTTDALITTLNQTYLNMVRECNTTEGGNKTNVWQFLERITKKLVQQQNKQKNQVTRLFRSHSCLGHRVQAWYANIGQSCILTFTITKGQRGVGRV